MGARDIFYVLFCLASPSRERSRPAFSVPSTRCPLPLSRRPEKRSIAFGLVAEG